MTVAELIAKLQEMPQDARVMTPDPEGDGFEEICSVKVATAFRRDEWCDGWWAESSFYAVALPGVSIARVVVLSDLLD